MTDEHDRDCAMLQGSHEASCDCRTTRALWATALHGDYDREFLPLLAQRDAAVRAETLREVRGVVEGQKYDTSVEGYNGFEASVFNGAINTALDALDALAHPEGTA
jgi:hypothetical protein